MPLWPSESCASVIIASRLWSGGTTWWHPLGRRRHSLSSRMKNWDAEGTNRRDWFWLVPGGQIRFWREDSILRICSSLFFAASGRGIRMVEGSLGAGKLLDGTIELSSIDPV